MLPSGGSPTPHKSRAFIREVFLAAAAEEGQDTGTAGRPFGVYSPLLSLAEAFGVVCVALVSRFVLRERVGLSQMIGFVMLAVATVLITRRP